MSTSRTRPRITVTHTYVVLEISKSAYEEIKTKLGEADYGHCFHEDTEFGEVIDMHGIALAQEHGEDKEKKTNYFTSPSYLVFIYEDDNTKHELHCELRPSANAENPCWGKVRPVSKRCDNVRFVCFGHRGVFYNTEPQI